jgi:hypothetical protein
MVQALAFAEIFIGAIVAYAGYKGATITQVMKGEALGPAATLGSALASSSTPGASVPAGPGETAPAGPPPAPSEGILTWPQLEREIKTGKLSNAQVEAKERILLGLKPGAKLPSTPSQNHPPTSQTLTGERTPF